MNLDDVDLSQTKLVSELTGDLGVFEFSQLFFRPERFFWLKGIDPDVTRANHAHRTCHQLLICLAGRLKATVTAPSGNEKVFHLEFGEMLYLKPLMWLQLSEFSNDAVLGVLASEPYDPDEYINDFQELRQLGVQ